MKILVQYFKQTFFAKNILPEIRCIISVFIDRISFSSDSPGTVTTLIKWQKISLFPLQTCGHINLCQINGKMDKHTFRPYEENKGAPAMAGLENGEGPEEAVGAESAQKALEEGECQTCEKRKYQDGSDDMGVSFQTPTNIAPEQAASAVRGHENEHVVRERAKADREDRRVVSQSVTLHTDICPECGKAYVSGGTTRTVTAAERENPYTRQEQEETRTPFSVMA